MSSEIYTAFLHPPFERDMYPVSVYFGMFIQFLTTIPYFYWVDQAAEGLDEGSDVDLFFSLKGSTLRKIPSFSSLHQPRTSYEYHLCILAMFTMSRNDVKHVSLEVLSSYLQKWDPLRNRR